MSMVELKIDDRECLRVLEKIRRKTADASPLMAQLAGDMHDAVEMNFDKEGRPDKWKPLKPSTIRNRKRKGNWPGKILQARGRLVSSIMPWSDSRTAMVGTNVTYAKIQHFGGGTKHAARERILHFDQRKRGSITHGRPGRNVDHFATSSKAKYAMKVTSKAYQSTITARPYMLLTAGDIDKMKRHGIEYLRKL